MHLEPIIIAAGARAERNAMRIRYGLTWAKTHLAQVIGPDHTFTPHVYHDRSSTFGLTVEKAAWGLRWRSTSFRFDFDNLGGEAGMARNAQMIEEALRVVAPVTPFTTDLVVCVAFPSATSGNAWDCLRQCARQAIHSLVVPYTEPGK